MGDRCTGRCCRDFDLPFTPDALRAAAATARAAREAQEPTAPGAVARVRNAEVEQIAAMVIPLRPEPGAPTRYRYRCANYDEDSGDCAIYDRRPDMCRDFPYGHACAFGDRCDWDAAREGRAVNHHKIVLRSRDQETHRIERVHLRVLREEDESFSIRRAVSA